jgi:hypothetical protein
MRIYGDAVFRFETYPSDTIARDIDQFHGQLPITTIISNLFRSIHYRQIAIDLYVVNADS